jgi:hypothetical protein
MYIYTYIPVRSTAEAPDFVADAHALLSLPILEMDCMYPTTVYPTTVHGGESVDDSL